MQGQWGSGSQTLEPKWPVGGQQRREWRGAACELALQVGGLQPRETQSQAPRNPEAGEGVCAGRREQGLQGERHQVSHARRSDTACMAGLGRMVLDIAKGLDSGAMVCVAVAVLVSWRSGSWEAERSWEVEVLSFPPSSQGESPSMDVLWPSSKRNWRNSWKVSRWHRHGMLRMLCEPGGSPFLARNLCSLARERQPLGSSCRSRFRAHLADFHQPLLTQIPLPAALWGRLSYGCDYLQEGELTTCRTSLAMSTYPCLQLFI